MDDWQLSTETQTVHTQKLSGSAGADAHTCACKHTSYSACAHSQAAQVRSSPKELKGHSVTHRYSEIVSVWPEVSEHTHTKTHTQSTETLIYIYKFQTVV